MKTIPSILCIFLLFISCSENEPRVYDDTATSGSISICVDETFKPIMDSQIATFEAIYKNTHILPEYVAEGDAFRKLINDSCRLIVSTRELNENEMKYFESIQLKPKTTKIAKDAIAFICHNQNPDSVLTEEQVLSIFSGKIKQWKDLNPSNGEDEIRIVFDHSNSSTARYMKEELLAGNSLPKNCFATSSNEDVINYCSEHPEALGIIGVGWISDGDDPSSLTFKNKIRVIAIRPANDPESNGKSYKPYQAYIAQQYYPYTRIVYIISREARNGLGSGFTAFVAGDKGQRIILKAGLMPATKPVRIVGFRNNE